MQVKIKFSLPVLFVVFALNLTASAQDGVQPDADVKELNSHPELNLNDDKTLIDFDSKSPKIQSVPAPSAIKKAEAQAKAGVEKKEKTEDDPLSFNFLYLIIQKFKISDIVDDWSPDEISFPSSLEIVQDL